jgi:hypothetical protein
MTSNEVFVGTGDGFEVASFTLDGTRGRTLRETRTPVALTAGHVDRFVSRLAARRAGRGSAGEVERIYRELEYPKEFPPYAALMTDGQNNLWVEGFPIPGEATRKWFVYSSAGVAIASLQVPSNFEVLGAGRDYVYGIWRDDDDVDFVRVYPLLK